MKVWTHLPSNIMMTFFSSWSQITVCTLLGASSNWAMDWLTPPPVTGLNRKLCVDESTTTTRVPFRLGYSFLMGLFSLSSAPDNSSHSLRENTSTDPASVP